MHPMTSSSNAIIQIGKGNAYKELQKLFKKIHTIFEILKIIVSLLIYHIPYELIHSTLTKSKNAEECQSFIEKFLGSK